MHTLMRLPSAARLLLYSGVGIGFGIIADRFATGSALRYVVGFTGVAIIGVSALTEIRRRGGTTGISTTLWNTPFRRVLRSVAGAGVLFEIVVLVVNPNAISALVVAVLVTTYVCVAPWGFVRSWRRQSHQENDE